jgi:hypothetical protein
MRYTALWHPNIATASLKEDIENEKCNKELEVQ